MQNYNTGTVTDLNGTNIGGVPALFKAFTQQVGLNYNVSLETQPGSNLDFHYDNRLSLIDKPWDKVVMHGQSTLDFGAPGDPTKLSNYTKLLGDVFQAQNPNVDISLTATWARADLTYNSPGNPWYGKPISAMAYDVQAGYSFAAAQNPNIVDRVIPVGLAWNRAMEMGLADPNPYDGVNPLQMNLWTDDSYHASNQGYYLHALMDFGMITGLDPRVLGANEQAAAALGISASEAFALQHVAAAQIAAIPEPSTWLLLGLGLPALVLAKRRARSAARETEAVPA